MAKRRVLPGDGRTTLDRQAYFIDEDNPTVVDRAVSDEVTHGKLDQLLDALGDGASLDQEYTYNEISSVAKDTPSLILTYTALAGVNTYLQRIDTSGTNIAEYTVLVDGSPIEKKWTNHGSSLSAEFVYEAKSNNGYPLPEGAIVTVMVTHSRPSTGDFTAKLQVLKI